MAGGPTGYSTYLVDARVNHKHQTTQSQIKPVGELQDAQWAKCLLCKHKDVSLNAQNPHKSQYNSMCLCPRAVVQKVEKTALKFIDQST